MSITLEKLALQGNPDFNRQMNASFAEKLIHARKQSIRDIFSDYTNVSNRLEHVATIFGMDFVNDAKASNVNAVWYALESIEKPVIWIVNEMNEESSEFEKLFPLIRSKVKTIILLSNTPTKPSHFLGDYVENLYKVNTIDLAVELAYTIGAAGDAILFSPASEDGCCYDSYTKGGEIFKNAVKSL